MRERAGGALAAVALVALLAAPAVAGAAVTSDRGQRPVVLPLPAVAVGGQVLGGQGDRVLLGGVVRRDGTGLPAEWRKRGSRWTVTDLSAHGRRTGYAASIDRHGDILINGDNEAWVVTPDRTAHRLRGFSSRSSGVFARQMNRRGEIAGAVFGPAPKQFAWGAEIGRASCRERVEMGVGGVSW